MIASDANAVCRHTVVNPPARGFRGHRIKIKNNVEFRAARQKLRPVRGVGHEHHLLRPISDMIAGMARRMAISRD